MAIFRFSVQPIGRSTGRRAIDVAAYRSGERLREERTGSTADYLSRQDVVHREIVLPAKYDGIAMDWARDRERLWNAAEHAEKYRNSRVAREYQLALPHELAAPQRRALTMAFARELAERHNVAVDATIHLPRGNMDPRNHHAHVLATTREVLPDGLGAKAAPELSGSVLYRRGLLNGRDEILALRARFAELTNEALRAVGLDVRVDARSLAAQGIDRVPYHQPWHIYMAAQRELRAKLGERMLDHYRGRSEASASAPPSPASQEQLPEKSPEKSREKAGSPAQSLEDVRRLAREAWLEQRARLGAEQNRDGSPEEHREREERREQEVAPEGKAKDDDAAL